MARSKLKHFTLCLHRVLGLALGTWFVLLGLTGSLLVFYLELDLVLRSGTRPSGVAQAASVDISPEAVLQRLRAQHPDRSGAWRIELPLHAAMPVRARYYAPKEKAGHSFAPLLITMDPLTLQETSAGFWGDDFFTWTYNLHYALLLDQGGRTAVGWAGIMMLVAIVSGTVLWWPRQSRWREALRPQIRPGKLRAGFDLHTRAGIYGGLIFLLLALTGTGLAWPEFTRKLLQGQSSPHSMAKPFVEPLLQAPTHSLDKAIQTALTGFPGAEARWIESSSLAGSAIMIRIHQEGEPSRRFPQTMVWVHPVSGKILKLQDPKTAGVAQAVLAWLHPLHNGEAFGLTGRWVVLLSGLVLPLLMVTGGLRYLQKQRADTLNARRRKPSQGLSPRP